MDQLKVVLCWPATNEHVNTLREKLHVECEILYPTESDALIELSRDADIFVVGFGATIPKQVWQASSQLKLIQSLNVGVDNIEALTEVPVAVANVSRAHSVAVAEHAVAMLLAWCKQIVPADNGFKEDRWVRPPHTSHLSGKSAGIVGLGNIGTEIAKRLTAFELRLLGVKRNPSGFDGEPFGIDEVYESGELTVVLRQSDYVFIATPLTDKTEGMIGPGEFKAMKKTAVLVNIARAEIVQEEALYDALVSDRIAGACLDVWYSKPSSGAMFEGKHSPSRFPINRLPNVIASPHLGYKTEDAFERVWSIVAENIAKVSHEQTPTNLVNKEAGY